jgi:hypothetical protein
MKPNYADIFALLIFLYIVYADGGGRLRGEF